MSLPNHLECFDESAKFEYVMVHDIFFKSIMTYCMSVWERLFFGLPFFRMSPVKI